MQVNPHPLLRLAATTLLAVGLACPTWAQTRDTVLATGSSTVAPFTRAVAEVLAEGGAKRAEVRSVGTLGGYAEFCQGALPRYADIQDASRRMNFSEFTHCASRGVHEIMEIPIGYDGIVIAHRADLPSPNFTRAQLWRGIAKEVPQDGKLVPNPNTTWRQVDPALPDWPIRLIGPPVTSGTRDSFTDLVLLAGCQGVPEIRTITDLAQKKRACVTVRTDGGWTDGGEDDDLIARQVVEGPPGTLGVFGFSFLEGHRDMIEGASVEGIDETRENIANGSYPISRPLFIYVKRPNLESTPGLKAFVAEYVSDRAMGPEGYLVRRGLVPLEPALLRRVQAAVRDQAIMLGRPGN